MQKLNKTELLKLITILYNGEDKDDKQFYSILQTLEYNIADPNIYDYIKKHNLTPEEILEKALSYKPLITPPPKKD